MSDTPKPTLDERIAAIAKLLELLTGIVNALAEAQIKTEARLDRLVEAQARTDARLDRLIRLVARHEQKLDALEG